MATKKTAKKVAVTKTAKKAIKKQGAVKRNVGSSRAEHVGSSRAEFVGSTHNRDFHNVR